MVSERKECGQRLRRKFPAINYAPACNTPEVAWTWFEYDHNGNVTKVTDPRGYETTSTYDERNRRKTTTNALNQTTSWAYDKANNLTKETRPDTKYRTWDTYDSMNRVTHTTGFLSAETTGYVYDVVQNKTEMTDAKGAIYTFNYDLITAKPASSIRSTPRVRRAGRGGPMTQPAISLPSACRWAGSRP